MKTVVPAFKPHIVVHPLQEGLVLLSERGASLFKGSLYCRVAALIDGTNTKEQIISNLEPFAIHTDIVQVLKSLEDSGYLTDGPFGIPQAQAVFWSALGIDGESCRSLNDLAVDVIMLGDLDIRPWQNKLCELGVSVRKDASVHLVVAEDYLCPQLAQLNKRFIDEQCDWLLVKPFGSIPWIGPLFQPQSTACWECLATTLRMNRQAWLHTQSSSNTPVFKTAPLGYFSLGFESALNLAALEILKWYLVRRTDALQDKLVTLDLQRLQTESHPVIKRPQCSACGNSFDKDTAIKLISRAKLHGEARACSLPETHQRLVRHVSHITGIVSSLSRGNRRRGEEASPVHVYIAKFRGSSRLRACDSPVSSKMELAFGKGKSDMQAEVSCIAEALERFCGAYDDADPVTVARYRDLCGAIHPHDLLNFSAKQYDNRLKTNKDDDLFNWVPHPFEEDSQIEWTKVWSLRDSQVRYLPTAYCFYYYPDKDGRRFCIANSNGCASGNTMEEAILQGLFELVERDCAAAWWYNRLRMPEVDLTSVDTPYFFSIRRYIESKQRCLRLIDISNDLGIPTFAAVSWKEDGHSIISGFGTHLNAQIAAEHAITELSQKFPFALRAEESVSENLGPHEARMNQWLREARVQDQPHFQPDNTKLRKLSQYDVCESNDLLADITYLVNKLAAAGLDTLVLDMTRPDVSLATARVVVPGLRLLWARLAPGRLYDVPVKQGHLSKPLQENQLNPIAYFL